MVGRFIQTVAKSMVLKLLKWTKI